MWVHPDRVCRQCPLCREECAWTLGDEGVPVFEHGVLFAHLSAQVDTCGGTLTATFYEELFRFLDSTAQEFSTEQKVQLWLASLRVLVGLDEPAFCRGFERFVLHPSWILECKREVALFVCEALDTFGGVAEVKVVQFVTHYRTGLRDIKGIFPALLRAVARMVEADTPDVGSATALNFLNTGISLELDAPGVAQLVYSMFLSVFPRVHGCGVLLRYLVFTPLDFWTPEVAQSVVQRLCESIEGFAMRENWGVIGDAVKLARRAAPHATDAVCGLVRAVLRGLQWVYAPLSLIKDVENLVTWLAQQLYPSVAEHGLVSGVLELCVRVVDAKEGVKVGLGMCFTLVAYLRLSSEVPSRIARGWLDAELVFLRRVEWTSDTVVTAWPTVLKVLEVAGETSPPLSTQWLDVFARVVVAFPVGDLARIADEALGLTLGLAKEVPHTVWPALELLTAAHFSGSDLNVVGALQFMGWVGNAFGSVHHERAVACFVEIWKHVHKFSKSGTQRFGCAAVVSALVKLTRFPDDAAHVVFVLTGVHMVLFVNFDDETECRDFVALVKWDREREVSASSSACHVMQHGFATDGCMRAMVSGNGQAVTIARLCIELIGETVCWTDSRLMKPLLDNAAFVGVLTHDLRVGKVAALRCANHLFACIREHDSFPVLARPVVKTFATRAEALGCHKPYLSAMRYFVKQRWFGEQGVFGADEVTALLDLDVTRSAFDDWITVVHWCVLKLRLCEETRRCALRKLWSVRHRFAECRLLECFNVLGVISSVQPEVPALLEDDAPTFKRVRRE